jgi:hypothetical protein
MVRYCKLCEKEIPGDFPIFVEVYRKKKWNGTYKYKYVRRY